MNIRRTCVGLLAAASWAFGWPASAFAHGALVLSQDVCLLKVGPDYMYFSGYRSATPRKRFCEDVPETGETIFSTSVFRKLSKPAAQSFITGFPVVVVLARERRRAVAASATLYTSLPIVVRFFRETPTGEKSEQCALTQTVKAHV